MTDIEVMQVLSEIVEDCFYRKHCSGCKFNRDSECILKDIPSEWDIDINEEEEIE